LATVKWDDEGVEPETFPIIENGVVVDYQTTREQAAWLSPWYQSRQRPVRSHGCAVAPGASNFPLQHTPNLQVKPGAGTTTFEEMIQNTSRGIAFLGGLASTDFQSRTGAAGGMMREIVNGKLGPVLVGGQLLFDSTQLWKNLTELGGANSGETIGAKSGKGQPAQVTMYSVQAVAGRFKEMAVVDEKRK
jgi:TldD protein